MRTYIISGAGSGIGAAIAEKLASDNENHLILIGRNMTKLNAIRDRLANPLNHELLACSVTDAEKIRSSFEELQLANRNVCGVIANAGIAGANAYGPEDRWDDIIQTNVKGVYILGNEALPYLKGSTEEYKNVVIISSVVAHMGVPGLPAYCASKAAVLGLMRSWAAEWASLNILVNAICPGWVETEMARDGIQGIADVCSQTYDEALKTQMNLLPLRKMSQPAEVASLVNFLCSNQETSMTGEEFQINNGAIMR